MKLLFIKYVVRYKDKGFENEKKLIREEKLLIKKCELFNNFKLPSALDKARNTKIIMKHTGY